MGRQTEGEKTICIKDSQSLSAGSLLAFPPPPSLDHSQFFDARLGIEGAIFENAPHLRVLSEVQMSYRSIMTLAGS